MIIDFVSLKKEERKKGKEKKSTLFVWLRIRFVDVGFLRNCANTGGHR